MYASPIVVDAAATPLAFRVRIPGAAPKVRFVRYAFVAVRPVLDA